MGVSELILILIVVSLIWRRSSSRHGHPASPWFVIMQIMLVLAGLMLVGWLVAGLAYRGSHEQKRASQRQETLDAYRQSVRIAQSSTEDSLTLEEQWQRLNKPKIQLEDQTPGSAGGSPGEQTDEDAKRQAAPQPEPPDWVVNPPKRIGNTQRRVIVSGPYRTADECHEDLNDKLRQAMLLKLAEIDGRSSADWQGDPPDLESMGIGLSYIRREICRNEYVKTVEHSFGPMKQVHLLMEFDPSVEQHLKNVWQKYEQRGRTHSVVSLAAMGLLMLGLVYGLLKFDTWTHGGYTKRLLLGAGAVIIGASMLWLA